MANQQTDGKFIPVCFDDPFIIQLKKEFESKGLPELPWKNYKEPVPVKLSWADLAASKKTLADILHQDSLESSNRQRTEISKKVQLRGIINSGNMCYMNSVLQVLIHCAPFGSLLMNVRDHVQYKIKSDTPVLDALAEFMGYFLGPNTDSNINPDILYNIIQKRFPHLERGRQEDAQEFLGYLLQALHEELEKHSDDGDSGDVEVEADEQQQGSDEWVEVGKKNKPSRSNVIKQKETAISRTFGGQFKSVLEVGNRPTSVTYEPFEQVQLDIDDPSVTSLEEAFELLSRPESLSYKLNNGTDTSALRTLTIDKVPKVLIVHLKRFAYTMQGIKKIAKPIQVPQTIDIRGMEKQLYAIVYHHGPVATAGHYTIDVKTNGKWYSIDDTDIMEMPTHGVLEHEPGKSAYLLFYM